MRQHLHVDADLVHLPDAQLAEIVQPLPGVARPPGFDARVGRGQFGVPIMLLQRDDWTFRLDIHDVRVLPVPEAGFLATAGGAVTKARGSKRAGRARRLRR